MPLIRYRTLITYLVVYFMTISVGARSLTDYAGQPILWPTKALFGLFFLLLAFEPWLSRRSHRYTHFYLAIQTGVVSAAIFIPPHPDYFARLYSMLAIQTANTLPPRIGFRWIGVFSVIVTLLMIYGFGWDGVLSFAISYVVIQFAVAVLWYIMREADIARNESQRLLSELQVAHQKLEEYAAQAEELAATRERNHLARELHDSVTQTIFSITLTAKSAAILLKRDPEQAAGQLDHLQSLAQGALAEMRALIFQLRPSAVEEEGLVSALHKHIAALTSQDGLAVELHVDGERCLSGEQERRLFRIVQEALNNVIKHAQTNQAVVSVTMNNGQVSLLVEDEGRGFDPTATEPGLASMGLASMRERAEMLGGTFRVESCPGEGTRIRVEIPQVAGDEADG